MKGMICIDKFGNLPYCNIKGLLNSFDAPIKFGNVYKVGASVLNSLSK
jgi:hypothetical protein